MELAPSGIHTASILELVHGTFCIKAHKSILWEAREHTIVSVQVGQMLRIRRGVCINISIMRAESVALVLFTGLLV